MHFKKPLLIRAIYIVNIQISSRQFHMSPTMCLDQPIKKWSVYRYNPDNEKKPYYQEFEVDLSECGATVLHALIKIKDDQDPTLAFRRSCREGICGNCAMNVNGINVLACITKINKNVKKIDVVRPLPHGYVIKDLIIDMNYFFKQYKDVQPWLQKRKEYIYGNRKQYLQTINERAKLDKHYECVLCGACSYSCPSYWWNGTQDRFPGPAALLHAHRWIIDSRDDMQENRLAKLRGVLSVYRCHTIMNCIPACPKGLNPAYTIAKLKGLLAGFEKKPIPELQN